MARDYRSSYSLAHCGRTTDSAGSGGAGVVQGWLKNGADPAQGPVPCGGASTLLQMGTPGKLEGRYSRPTATHLYLHMNTPAVWSTTPVFCRYRGVPLTQKMRLVFSCQACEWECSSSFTFSEKSGSNINMAHTLFDTVYRVRLAMHTNYEVLIWIYA